MTMRLESSHLTLIPLQFTDANDLNAAVRESLATLAPWHAWATDTYTLRNTQEHVQQAVTTQRDGTAVTYIVRGKAGRLMGEVTLTPVADTLGHVGHAHRLSFWLRQSELGKGYEVEALKAVIQHALSKLGSKRVDLHLSSRDSERMSIAQEAGLAPEATLKNTQRMPDGSLADTMVFVKLA
ncbi:MAG: GNAT family N-acetyltransferase [Pseudomonadaceae bacterium]|nr:GNAT family N-acetyltransferase [Pseudomonadaceae bacterium]